MAYKPEIQYIEQFFIPGSEAPQLQPQRGGQPARKPRVQQEKKIRILVDPVAMLGLVVAVTMLVLMAVGVYQYNAASRRNEAVSDYLLQLQDTNITREYQYRTKLDLNKIAEQAKALGMIPASEAQTITVHVEVPQPEPENTWWDDLVWFLEGLFA
jgi:hypothetical protein